MCAFYGGVFKQNSCAGLCAEKVKASSFSRARKRLMSSLLQVVARPVAENEKQYQKKARGDVRKDGENADSKGIQRKKGADAAPPVRAG